MAFRLSKVLLDKSGLRKMVYNMSGFNKYGLYRDDCLYEDEDVTEALRRIPKHLIDERNFRIIRAVQLSMTKTILPKDQWTRLEDDHLYLTPVVTEVAKERKEREAWEANY